MNERADDDKPFEGGMLGAGEQIDAGPADELLAFAGSKRFATVLADPPWRFSQPHRQNGPRASPPLALQHNGC